VASRRKGEGDEQHRGEYDQTTNFHFSHVEDDRRLPVTS
jgi:hypothetical protein